MIETKIPSLLEIEDLSKCALVAAKTCKANARPLARETAATKVDGVVRHGLPISRSIANM